MKKTYIYILISTILICGCASLQSNEHINDIKIELISTEYIFVKTGYITNKLKGTTITGKLERRYRINNWQLHGHVHVEVLDTEGAVIYDVKKGNLKKANMRSIRDVSYRYNVDIPFVPSDENIIRVTYHEKSLR